MIMKNEAIQKGIIKICLSLCAIIFALSFTLPLFAAPEGPWWIRTDCLCADGTQGHKHTCQNQVQTEFPCNQSDLGYVTHCQTASDNNCDAIPE